MQAVEPNLGAPATQQLTPEATSIRPRPGSVASIPGALHTNRVDPSSPPRATAYEFRPDDNSTRPVILPPSATRNDLGCSGGHPHLAALVHGDAVGVDVRTELCEDAPVRQDAVISQLVHAEPVREGLGDDDAPPQLVDDDAVRAHELGWRDGPSSPVLVDEHERGRTRFLTADEVVPEVADVRATVAVDGHVVGSDHRPRRDIGHDLGGRAHA